jgi:hypothetical protein
MSVTTSEGRDAAAKSSPVLLRRGVVDAVNASFPVVTRGHHHAAQWSSHGRSCPRCHGPVYRVPRRFVDLCVSLLMPVRRYRCGEMGCAWEGNLHAKRHPRPSLGPSEPASAGIGASDPAPMGHATPSGRPPR